MGADSMTIRVVNVAAANLRKLGLTPAEVCYVGRAGRFHGWPASKWANPYRPRHRKVTDREQVSIRPPESAIAECLRMFRVHAKKQPESWLAELWEACWHGAKPLGCWCVDSTHGDGQPVVCHAQILAELLAERFGEAK